MFEFENIRYKTKLIIELNNAMPHYNERLPLKRLREKTKATKEQNNNFTAKTQYLNLKAIKSNFIFYKNSAKIKLN